MKLSDKIIGLRKSNGMSQEDLAEKLDVSRQAISRWESGTAMPDANNIVSAVRYQNPLLRFTEEIEGLLLLPVQTEEYRDRSQCEWYLGTYLSRT